VRGVTQVLLVVIGLLLIGLPLLALVADRVLPPPRRRPPPAPDTRQKLIRRFHLTWQDALEVEAAVREGRTTRPDLQPAARGFAEHTLTPPTFRGRPLTSYPLAARWAWLVFAIAALAFLGYAAALGSEVGLAYLIIYGPVAALSIATRRSVDRQLGGFAESRSRSRCHRGPVSSTNSPARKAMPRSLKRRPAHPLEGRAGRTLRRPSSRPPDPLVDAPYSRT